MSFIILIIATTISQIQSRAVQTQPMENWSPAYFPYDYWDPSYFGNYPNNSPQVTYFQPQNEYSQLDFENHQLQMQYPKPSNDEIGNPQPQIEYPQHDIANLQTQIDEIQFPQSQIGYPQSKIENHQLQVQYPQLQIEELEFIQPPASTPQQQSMYSQADDYLSSKMAEVVKQMGHGFAFTDTSFNTYLSDLASKSLQNPIISTENSTKNTGEVEEEEALSVFESELKNSEPLNDN